MHPLGTYLAITDGQRDSGLDQAAERRPSFARDDASPITEPERRSRFARLAALLRRRVLRTAGA